MVPGGEAGIATIEWPADIESPEVTRLGTRTVKARYAEAARLLELGRDSGLGNPVRIGSRVWLLDVRPVFPAETNLRRELTALSHWPEARPIAGPSECEGLPSFEP